MLVKHDQLCGQRARVRVDRPLARAATTAVLIVQSGRMAHFDQPGYEAELYERLTGRLLSEGLAVVRFDIERSVSMVRHSNADKRAARTRRLREMVSKVPALAGTTRLIFLGASLGALSVMDVLAREHLPGVAGALLIGCVLEEPQVVMSPLARLELLYGERDCIVYVEAVGAFGQPIAPTQYAQLTLNNLVLLPSSEAGVHILAGAGHLLEGVGARSPNEHVLDLLVALICRAADVSARSLASGGTDDVCRRFAFRPDRQELPL